MSEHVCRFENYKDKEYVRMAAPMALAGKRYSVREQFPPEIEEKRKLLYPIAKRARENKNNIVKLVRDKLYVNGKETDLENVPPSDSVIFQRNERQPYSSYTNELRQVPQRQRETPTTQRYQPQQQYRYQSEI